MRTKGASMGPRSLNRENSRKVVAWKPNIGQLQGGRDHVIAEMRSGPSAKPPQGPASMGPRSRDRGNGALPARLLRQARASMGPRSRDRGNPDEGLSFTTSSSLQWGRDHVIAEIRLFPCLEPRAICFNGAAIT